MYPVKLPLSAEGPFDPPLIRSLLADPSLRRLSPWLYRRVLENDAQLPPELKENLKRTYLITLRRNIVLKQELDNQLRSFAAKKVPIIPLKGPLLALRLYGDLGLRPTTDLDMLILPQDIIKAQNILLRSGFQIVVNNKNHFHLSFHKQQEGSPKIILELHRALTGYPLGDDYLPFGLRSARNLSETIWEKTEICQSSDIEYWQMAPSDEFLYLCLHLTNHLVKERDYGTQVVSNHSPMLALDIYLVLKSWRSIINWADFEEQIATLHLQNPVTMALAYASYWFDCNIPDSLSISANLPRWQHAYFIQQTSDKVNRASRRFIPLLKLHRFLICWVMSDNWQDRWHVFHLSYRSILRSGKRLFAKHLRRVNLRVRHFLPAWACGRYERGDLDIQLLDIVHISQLLTLYGVKNTKPQRDSYMKLLQDPNQFAVGAFFKDQLIGSVWCGQHFEQLGVQGYWLSAGQVHPNFRRRSVSHHIYDSALEEAKHRKIDHIYGSVRVGNEAGMAAALSVGFRPIENPDWQSTIETHLKSQQVILMVHTN